jgi:glyoxylase-like metal-dependent hydrolase (beta-lactamase superfamily II)
MLTDPNFLHRGDRAYVGLGITTRRLTEPAMSVERLARLDSIVLSHHHGDHIDRVAARRRDHDLPVTTEPHAARKLTSQVSRRPIATLLKFSPAEFTGPAEKADLSTRIRYLPRVRSCLSPLPAPGLQPR